jgi:type I restriction enzyme S subunit
MSWRKVELSALLVQIKHIVKIDNSKEYKLVTVSSKGTIKQREIVKGVEIKGEKAFEAISGKFIYSRLSVHNGAFGIVPLELDGALLTSEMPIFEISDKILPEFLIYSLQLPTFKFQLEQLTKGVGRTRVKEANFLSLIIDLPNISDQETIIKSLIKAEQHSGLISSELTRQLSLVKKLRQQLLQDAVQGKLVEQNKKDEPASELLKKIKAEKEKLIADKKLKKEKELPTIKPEEIPFEIPDNWSWCRLGEICDTITKGSSPNWQGVQYVDEAKGILFITSKNVDSFKIDLTKATYVEEKFNEIEPRSILKKGDLLTNIVGASIGRTALFDLDVIANINQAVCILRIEHHLINKDYLLNLMNSDLALKMMFESQFAPGRANLSMGNIASFTIPIPPLTEQIRIVQKVDELMQYCNKLEASIKQSESQNEKLLQQVLREVLRKEPVEA